MKYNFEHIDDIVANSIRKSFFEYYNDFTENRKLSFVKRIKDDTGLGLKDSKNNADIIFGGGIKLFENTFSIKQQRKTKLDDLKRKLLLNELVRNLKLSNEDMLYDILSILDIDNVESLLNKYLELNDE